MASTTKPPEGGFSLPCKSCSRCGEIFAKPYKISSSQWAARQYCSKKCAATKLDLDDGQVVDLYLRQKKSSGEIGALLGLSAVHVRRVLQRNGIAIRAASENKKLSAARPETRQRIRKAMLGKKHSAQTIALLKLRHGPLHSGWLGGITKTAQGYLQFTNSPANGDKAGKLVHQVVGRDKYGARIQPGMHLHHVDGNKLNNAAGNLLLMTDSAHAKWHKFGKH